MIEHLEGGETLAEKVKLVIDVAERFMAGQSRGVTPSEVTEAKALLTSMRHYDHALAPIRKLHLNWHVPKERENDIPPAAAHAGLGARFALRRSTVGPWAGHS